MPVFKKEEQKDLFFIHIPKVGGASIEAFLRKTHKMHLHNTVYQKLSLPCSPQHFHANIIENILHKDIYENSFTVVRNPINRFVSEYKYRMNQRIGNGRPLISLHEFTLNSLANYKENEFILDNHLRPQNEFLHTNTRIYKFENGLENALISEGLFEKGVDKLPHINDSKNGVLDYNLNETVISLLKDFYKKDFEAFSY